MRSATSGGPRIAVFVSVHSRITICPEPSLLLFLPFYTRRPYRSLSLPIPDGRRPIYLFSLPTLCIASLGVAFARSVPALLIWRIIQAFGCSSGMSVGAAVIGDIYRLEERGTAMGVFFGVRRPLSSYVGVR
jgi:MFS family permease